MGHARLALAQAEVAKTVPEVATTCPDCWAAPAQSLLYGIPIAVLALAIFAILMIRAALGSATGWSLADALSEEAEVTAMETPPVGLPKPVLQADGKPLIITVLRASSSRVIALMEMVAILLMFLGFGTFALFSFGAKGTLPPSIDNVIKFLVSGLTLFAPYVINKFAGLFEALSPKK